MLKENGLHGVFSWVDANGVVEHHTGESWDRRRNTQDRRISGPAQRIRRGLWLEYHRRSDSGKFDIVTLSLKTRDKLLDATLREAARYTFTDPVTAAPVPSMKVATIAVEAVLCQFSSDRECMQQAVFVIDSIADYILSHFGIEMIDKRRTETTPTIDL